MTDFEITRLCAEAMGYTTRTDHVSMGVAGSDGLWCNETGYYTPLTNDAQAMALVKKFGLTCIYELGQGRVSWNVQHWRLARNENLNRAICECVAKMQTAKEPA